MSSAAEATPGALDVTAARARFTALDRPLAFFDGPGGTQCPDEVIDAIGTYLRRSNANVGAPYETSRQTDELVAAAHDRAASFLRCDAGEVAFGQSMTALNFLFTRALGRELRAGDEVLVTRLDHDANVAPWLALADDIGIVVRFVDVTQELALDLDDLEAKLSDRTRVVAFPAAANSVGTAPDVRRVVDLAHDAGALAWVDAVHYGPHGPIDVATWGCDVLVCSPYKFFGPHMGVAFGREELLRSWRPYKVRPAADEPVGHRFELGTCQHELLAGFVAAVDYVDSLGWDAITAHERTLGERFLAGLPGGVTLHGLPTMDGRVPTFCFTVPGRTARSVAEHLGARDVAVWWGNYYALETMRELGLDEVDGAVRAGIVHYNTAEEVDRLLAGIAELV
ncbi:MAG TPA: cysteine desulfurase-like protein [Gaiella sp.]|jgi:cysteine desulfurase family protein (TIGR01976 family)|nr:cysteine desulfurase-like protein [Gaiella sp.]